MTQSFPHAEAVAATEAALAACTRGGASYAEARVVQFRTQHFNSRETNLQSAFDHATSGIGVRVLRNGQWGFAAAPSLEASAARNAAAQALAWTFSRSPTLGSPLTLPSQPAQRGEWRTPHQEHPFSLSTKEKVEFLRDLAAQALARGAQYCDGNLWLIQEHKVFASTEGSLTTQEILRVWCELIPTVTTTDGSDYETRSTSFAPTGRGFEALRALDWPGELERCVEHAKAKLAAPLVSPGTYDLVIHPSNLWLTIHETCGHATEYDRAIGYEADYAGTSFLTPDTCGTLRYGSSLVSFVGNRTEQYGLATVGYDDEGCPAQEFPIVEKGIFTNYQTNREFAARLGCSASRGCAYADSWQHIPLQRMPNICLKPGDSPLSLAELIASTEDGLFVVGDKSYSIDQQRRNFQFSGQEFWRIRNGKLDGMVRDAAYYGTTTAFWNSLDALCDKREYFLGGSLYCGKGQPPQLAPVSHGAVPARFREVSVIRSGGTR